MQKVTVGDLGHVEHPMGVNSVRRPVSEGLGTTDFGLVYYELEPGEAFSGGLRHRHGDQEEVFYILDGTATFQIGRDPARVTVGEGEAIRIAPGEFQKGTNESSERVVALGFGAPGRRHDWAELEVLIECPECNGETIHDCLPVGSSEWQAERIDLGATCRECGTSISTARAD
jgi:uncharacterized cupin superfamily protein